MVAIVYYDCTFASIALTTVIVVGERHFEDLGVDGAQVEEGGMMGGIVKES